MPSSDSKIGFYEVFNNTLYLITRFKCHLLDFITGFQYQLLDFITSIWHL